MSVFDALRQRVLKKPAEVDATPRHSAGPANCPVDGIQMELGHAGSDPLHECKTCGGVWLSSDTLNALLDADAAVVEPHFTEVHEGGADHQYGDRTAARKCPQCGVQMENFMFAYSSEVWIDACPSDHGVWLDGGELKKLWDYERRAAEPTPEEQARMAAAFLTILDADARQQKMRNKARHTGLDVG